MTAAVAIPRQGRPTTLDPLAVGVEVLVVVAILANIAITFTNSMVRFFAGQDFPWSTDAWSILISIIAFLGAPAYFRRDSGMAYMALIDQAEGFFRECLQASGLAIFFSV